MPDKLRDSRPPAWCDAHHVIGWYHGGRTDLSNLVLLCRRHHRAVHRGVWSIVDAGNGRFAFELDRGTAGSNPAPPAERRRDAA
ncbi:MAG: HNH endonuclease signature motif containing protein [Geodermatophilaceae bacterium]